MPARCVSCDWLKPTVYLDSLIVGDTIYWVCGPCRDNLAGPGKHQAVSEDDRALCVVLEYLAGVSGEDEMVTDDYQGYVGVFGRFMLIEDDRGFVEVRTFSTMADACKELYAWEADGFGAREDDAWISSDNPRGYEVSFDGKYVGTYPRLNRAKAKLALLMRDSGYWPTAWLDSGRGSVRMIDDVRYLAPLTDKEN